MVKRDSTIELYLYGVFAALFGLIVVAVFLPTEPIFVVFPAWSLLVLVAMTGTLVIGLVTTIQCGWPKGEDW